MSNKTKKIVVFGCKGNLGREVERIFSKNKYTVFGYAHSIVAVESDLAMQMCNDFEKPILVVNCAAYNNVDEAETVEGRYLAYISNAIGPAKLALGCSLAGIPLIHISTDYVFNTDQAFSYNSITDVWKTKPLLEYGAGDPKTVYGKSKLFGEKAVQEICPKYWIVRTSGVFGRFGEGFPTRIVNLATLKKKLQFSDDSHYCPTYAVDLAAVIFEVFKKKIPYGVYHACGEPTTPYAFAKEILSHIGKKPTGIPFSKANKGRAPRPQYSVLSCEKLKKAGIERPRGISAIGNTFLPF